MGFALSSEIAPLTDPKARVVSRSDMVCRHYAKAYASGARDLVEPHTILQICHPSAFTRWGRFRFYLTRKAVPFSVVGLWYVSVREWRE